MISIIIPVYKVEKYLRRCLDSILAQTYSEWECILVDDGSPDESGKICDEYACNDVRFKVVHKKNGGVSSARNEGLVLAKGEWIAFVDSDDYVSKEWLYSVSQYILQHDKADCFVWGHYIDRNEEKTFKPQFPSGKIYSSNSAFVRSSDYKHVIWCFLCRNNLISTHNCRFPVGIRTGEDQCFILEYLSHTQNIVTIPKSYYYYVDNPTSAVNTRVTLYDTEDALRVALRFSEYCKEEKVEQIVFKSYAVKQLFYIYLYLIYDRGYSFSWVAQKTYRKYYNQIQNIQPSTRFDAKLKMAYLTITFYSAYLFVAQLRNSLLRRA